MNPSDPVIVLKDIRKRYGTFEALKGIDLTIPAGELFGFLGPNGAGKTTLIRILTGILKPTTGTVTIGGADLLTQPEIAKSRIGYVPDRPYLYEKLTPLEYFDFVAGLYALPEGQARQRGEEMLHRFTLWEWRDELIESFSHGMKQKVAMSAALLHDPDILVVDEPTVGLDPRSVKIVRDFFKDLVRRGKTIFLTTHTLSVAEDLCDRIGIIHHGTLVALGTIDALREQARSPGSDLESIFLKLTEEEDLPPPAVTSPAA
ncbi:MAG: ABC transporter, ATP-binding protein [Candidatus Ozemobacter sibiricus]|jgi:ABC-2 type transport system ATP-binding protein|uniref:ABC transporter, ATP-binding protein n=1 Tax=Candidatus Ozemobacter sibiricus TaxID=2268124 RepID=A0A367ZUM0_9BACT|nr:MAG: ABC transporter, ATP-binding protein [Candidatus Ozemobacter sibiricus]